MLFRSNGNIKNSVNYPNCDAGTCVDEGQTAPVEAKVVEAAPAGMRQENLTVVSGGALKAFSVVCGAYSIKANAEGVKNTLIGENYAAMVVYNAERNLYRVVVGTFDDRASAENLRDSFKARHTSNADFQKAWLLYNAH